MECMYLYVSARTPATFRRSRSYQACLVHGRGGPLSPASDMEVLLGISQGLTFSPVQSYRNAPHCFPSSIAGNYTPLYKRGAEYCCGVNLNSTLENAFCFGFQISPLAFAILALVLISPSCSRCRTWTRREVSILFQERNRCVRASVALYHVVEPVCCSAAGTIPYIPLSRPSPESRTCICIQLLGMLLYCRGWYLWTVFWTGELIMKRNNLLCPGYGATRLKTPMYAQQLRTRWHALKDRRARERTQDHSDLRTLEARCSCPTLLCNEYSWAYSFNMIALRPRVDMLVYFIVDREREILFEGTFTMPFILLARTRFCTRSSVLFA